MRGDVFPLNFEHGSVNYSKEFSRFIALLPLPPLPPPRESPDSPFTRKLRIPAVRIHATRYTLNRDYA